MKYGNMNHPKASANLMVPVSTGRRRSTISFLGEEEIPVARTPVKQENTYQLKPVDKLNGHVVESVLEDVMQEKLSHVTAYDSETCKLLATEISEYVKARMKDHLVQRYRLICVVHIAELNNQSLAMVSRCLWNADYDNFWSREYKTNHLCAVATLYAVYLE